MTHTYTHEELEAMADRLTFTADIDLLEEHAYEASKMLRQLAAEKRNAVKDAEELQRLRALVNSPELHDFAKGVVLEAGHQRERWGNDHDAGKEPADWFWLIGYLSGKALAAHQAGNTDKALHHTISSAAALANWHGAILGTHNMRPGIDGDTAIKEKRSLSQSTNQRQVGEDIESEGLGERGRTVWVVQDETGEPIYCASYELACREHIANAINDHGIVEATAWLVLKYDGLQSAQPSTNAIAKQVSVPEGWQVVPIDSTAEMDEACRNACQGCYCGGDAINADSVWKAMLSAAPKREGE